MNQTFAIKENKCLIADETEDKKHDYLEQGNPEEHFEFHHPASSRLSALVNIFREKQDKFHKQQEAEHHQNLILHQ